MFPVLPSYGCLVCFNKHFILISFKFYSSILISSLCILQVKVKKMGNSKCEQEQNTQVSVCMSVTDVFTSLVGVGF